MGETRVTVSHVTKIYKIYDTPKDRFKETIKIFVHWLCKKFELGAEDDLVRDFQKENNILLDAEKQIQKEDRQKEWEMEL